MVTIPAALTLAAAEYGPVAVLVLVVVGIAAAILALTHLLGPKRHGPVKDSTYESGVDPIGDARRRFNVRFYIVAILFLVFDVEVVFLFPWAIIYDKLALVGLIEMLIFIGILVVGYYYAWRKGALEWA